MVQSLLQQVLFAIVFIITAINSDDCTYKSNDTCTIIPNTSEDIHCAQDLDCNVILNRINLKIANVICPSDDNLCVINCEAPRSCQGTEILASNTKEIHINIGTVDSGKNMEINGPGKNGGELYVTLLTEDSDFYDSSINAKPNSANIIIDCRIGNKCSNNIINGKNINSKQSNISILCNAPNSADCSNTNLSCSSHSYLSSNSSYSSTSCYFDCKSCPNSNVYTINGKNDINWYCEESEENSCYGSTIHCGSNYTLYNELIYNTIKSKWDYNNNQCGFNSSISDSTKNSEESFDFITTLLSLDPLYYVIFVLSLSLLCVLCILIFWVYHQRRWNKQLTYSQTKINSHIKYEQELFRVASIESGQSSRPQNGESSPASNIYSIAEENSGDTINVSSPICASPQSNASPQSHPLQQSPPSHSQPSQSNVSNPRKYKTKQHFKDNTTLSGIPESQISDLSLAVNHNKYSNIDRLDEQNKISIDETVISTLITESSTASSSSSSSSDSEDSEATTNITQSKKNKFALPVSYLKSGYVSNDTDMNLENAQLENINPSKTYYQLRVPAKVIAARKNKNKPHMTHMIKFGKHRKQTSNTTSMVSELTQVTENTQFTGISTNIEDSESSSTSSSQSSSTTSTQSNEEEEEEEEEELEVDAQTEYTVQTEETSNNTYSDNDNNTFLENSRITYDVTQKKMTIESDVLDADIMDNLYDNKIRPLGLSGKIKALQAQIEYNTSDNNSSSDSNAPSPKSLSINNRKETESTNLLLLLSLVTAVVAKVDIVDIVDASKSLSFWTFNNPLLFNPLLFIL